MLNQLKIKILTDKLSPKDLIPKTEGSAGIDLIHAGDELIILEPGREATISSGIAVAIPFDYVGLINPRSSTGSKNLMLRNQPGTIDSDYRGEIKLNVINNGDPTYNIDLGKKIGKPIVINPGDRIFQLVIVKRFIGDFIFTDDLENTERGIGGFGSTGK